MTVAPNTNSLSTTSTTSLTRTHSHILHTLSLAVSHVRTRRGTWTCRHYRNLISPYPLEEQDHLSGTAFLPTALLSFVRANTLFFHGPWI